MIEQQMAETAMELACRTTMTTWHLAYASEIGVLRTKLERVKKQLNKVVVAHSQFEQLIAEAHC